MIRGGRVGSLEVAPAIGGDMVGGEAVMVAILLQNYTTPFFSQSLSKRRSVIVTKTYALLKVYGTASVICGRKLD